MRWFAALWGIGGPLLIFCIAIHRLSIPALEAVGSELSWGQWLLGAGYLLLMLWIKGYVVFQRAFAPRLAARARVLLERANPLQALLAPLFCMAYFHTTARRQRATVGITLMVIVLTLIVRGLDQPWRGIVDLGVVGGLAYGVLAILYFGAQALGSESFPHSPELPANPKE